MGQINLGSGSYKDYRAWTQTPAGQQSAANHRAKYGDQSKSMFPTVWQPDRNWQQQLADYQRSQPGQGVAGSTQSGGSAAVARTQRPSSPDMSAYSVGRAQPVQASQGTPYGQPDFQQMFSPAGFGQMFNFQSFAPAPAPPRPAELPPVRAPYYGSEFVDAINAGNKTYARTKKPSMVSQDFDFEEGRRINLRLQDDPITKRVNDRRRFDATSGQLPYGIDDYTARTQGFAGNDVRAVNRRATYNQRAFNNELEILKATSARIHAEERAKTQQMREKAFAGPLAERAAAVAAQEAEYQQRLQRRRGTQPAFSFTIPPAVASPADLPPEQRPPEFTQTFTDPFGNQTQNNPMAQRDALIQRINEESLPYYMGQPGQFRPNLQELWGQAGNMVINGWANPLAGLFG